MIFTGTNYYKGLGCGIKGNCAQVRPGSAGEMPSGRIFLRIPARIYASFFQNHGELKTDRSVSAIGD